jgi:hypothetical protein
LYISYFCSIVILISFSFFIFLFSLFFINSRSHCVQPLLLPTETLTVGIIRKLSC